MDVHHSSFDVYLSEVLVEELYVDVEALSEAGYDYKNSQVLCDARCTMDSAINPLTCASMCVKNNPRLVYEDRFLLFIYPFLSCFVSPKMRGPQNVPPWKPAYV
jgi:hypothetical protein